MFDVVGVGTNSVDQVFVLPTDIQGVATSGKTRVTERYVFCGGQTATAISACAALGLRTQYVGAFGSDENGRLVRRALADRGVDLAEAIECDSPNREAVILIDSRGLRTVLWHRSDRLNLRLKQLRPNMLTARIVHVDDDDAAVALEASRIARASDIPVTSDIEHAMDRTEELIAAVTYPILQERLPEQLTGEKDPERALRKLRRLNPSVLCMTLGKQGAAALDGDHFHLVPAISVDVVDNTGAGDVFRAGFIYGLLQGWDVPRMLRFANAAAAASCRKLGAIPSVPSLDEALQLGGRRGD